MRRAMLLMLSSNVGFLACVAKDGEAAADTGGGDSPAKPEHDQNIAMLAAVQEAVNIRFDAFTKEFFERFEGAQANVNASIDDLCKEVGDLSARLDKLEGGAVKPGNYVDAALAGNYQKLHELVKETRGHVDALSRDVSSLRRGG